MKIINAITVSVSDQQLQFAAQRLLITASHATAVDLTACYLEIYRFSKKSGQILVLPKTSFEKIASMNAAGTGTYITTATTARLYHDLSLDGGCLLPDEYYSLNVTVATGHTVNIYAMQAPASVSDYLKNEDQSQQSSPKTYSVTDAVSFTIKVSEVSTIEMLFDGGKKCTYDIEELKALAEETNEFQKIATGVPSLGYDTYLTLACENVDELTLYPSGASATITLTKRILNEIPQEFVIAPPKIKNALLANFKVGQPVNQLLEKKVLNLNK